MPELTVSRFAPSACSCWSMARCAPEPSATIVMTAATPMMTPSIVSADRKKLARIDSTATRMISR